MGTERERVLIGRAAVKPNGLDIALCYLSCMAVLITPPGKLPLAAESDLMMGMKMPPARAEVEGMAGASRASATLRPYDRPNVLLPNAFTKTLAIRSPSPVFSKPCRNNTCTESALYICSVVHQHRVKLNLIIM